MDRRKFLAVAAVVALVIGCCLVMLLYPLIKGEDIFHPPPKPEDVGNSFLTALQQGDYESAFALCDNALKHELIDPANFEQEIMKYEIQPLDWELINRSVTSERAELSGSMSFVLHASGSFEITLIRYENDWKIAGFFLDYH